jgi:hypothetical protein
LKPFTPALYYTTWPWLSGIAPIIPMNNDADAQALPRENMALQFVQLQEDDVNNRSLGSRIPKYIRDPCGRTLHLETERIHMLPQYQRMAQFRWNQLYDSKENLRLSRAIARELKMQYDDYKLKKSLNV